MTDTLPDDARVREDEWLVVRCQLGERPAFDELIDRWHGPLSRYIRRMAGNDDAARDMTQDTWIRVLRGIGTLREPSRLRAWLFGIARRVLMDRLRARYAAPPMADDHDVTQIPAASIDAGEDDIETLVGELERLPHIEREILTLFYLQELSLAEIADVLAIPAGTVKSRLFRARQMLRRELTERGLRP